MQDVLNFLAVNKLWFIIGGVILAVLIIALIIVGVTASKKRKAVKEAEQAAIHKEKKPEIKTENKAVPASAVKVETVKQEVNVAKKDDTPVIGEQKTESVKEPIKIKADSDTVVTAENEPSAGDKKTTGADGEPQVSAPDETVAEPKCAPEESTVPDETGGTDKYVETGAKPAGKPTAKKKSADGTSTKAAKAAQEEKPETKTKKAYSGKWAVVEKGEGEYVSYLYASNGEIMLTSEVYATVKGAQGGIETIKKNVSAGNFEIHRDKNKNYYYKLKSASNKLLCVGESYSSRPACEKSIESVKKFALSAIVNAAVIEDKTLVNYVPTGEVQKSKEGYEGKWTIRSEDDAFMAYLYASNGELLLVSESYVSESGAKGAITNIVKNAEVNNFIIDKDKNGRYYYKLRNSQKSVLCVGETYEKFASCVAAIESVKRFSASAKLEI